MENEDQFNDAIRISKFRKHVTNVIYDNNGTIWIDLYNILIHLNINLTLRTSIMNIDWDLVKDETISPRCLKMLNCMISCSPTITSQQGNYRMIRMECMVKLLNLIKQKYEEQIELTEYTMMYLNQTSGMSKTKFNRINDDITNISENVKIYDSIKTGNEKFTNGMYKLKYPENIDEFLMELHTQHNHICNNIQNFETNVIQKLRFDKILHFTKIYEKFKVYSNNPTNKKLKENPLFARLMTSFQEVINYTNSTLFYEEYMANLEPVFDIGKYKGLLRRIYKTKIVIF